MYVIGKYATQSVTPITIQRRIGLWPALVAVRRYCDGTV